jgi:peptidoglycan/LPS O-acetylase OafA/YrhL
MHAQERKTVAAIQALRAFAVSVVVIDHAFPHLLPGGYIGVDIFFVISGCLITSHLMSQFDDGSFAFGAFYLRRARRLLPAALAVLCFTALGTVALLPPAWQPSTLTGVGAAALYVVNWFLAANSVNYFADSGVISPVNHFWSLSVEEQFYLIWPALMWLGWRCAMRARRQGSHFAFHDVVGGILSVLAVLSLIAAIEAVRRNSAAAYFFTHARAWEFALGGLAAVAVRRIWLPGEGKARPALFLGGWLALILSVWLIRPTSGAPGPAVLPAAIATALLLAIGDDHRLLSVGRLIRFRPLQWLGDASYSLYLWHWPLLVLAPFALNAERLATTQLLAILAATLVLAGLSRRYLETPFRMPAALAVRQVRSRRSWTPLAVYLALSAFVAANCIVMARRDEGKAAEVAQRLYELSLSAAPCFGARATEPGADCPLSHRLADADFALQSWASQIIALPNGNGCQNEQGSAALSPCFFGAPEDKAKRRIALLGDSHAGMWASALGQFVAEKGIRITVLLASSCPVTEDETVFATYLPADKRDACLSWRRAAAEAIVSDPKIDTVVVSGNAYSLKRWTPAGWAEDDGAGLAALWRRFVAAQKRVVVIDDVPMLPWKLPDCLSRPHQADDPCNHASAGVPASTPFGRATAMMPPGSVSYISFKDVFCDETTCHSVIGGVPAYMDADHISAPISRGLAVRIEPLIAPNGSEAMAPKGEKSISR